MQTDRDNAAVVEATTAFVRREVLPVDDEHDGDIEAAGGDALRTRLQAGARVEGLLAPHGPVDCGGLGLGMADRAPVFEAAGWSLFGPMALNINAPDEGNVHLLDHVASGEQRARYLAPLVSGQARSAFAMTEPAPGAGADPDDADDRSREGGRRVADQRSQVVHHRRGRRHVLHHHGAYQW